MLLRLLVIVLFAASLTLGQSTRHRHRTRTTARRPHSAVHGKSSELVHLAEKLRAQGAIVVLTREKVSQPFFSVARRIININGEALQVFEYSTPSAANAEGKLVSPNGDTIGTSKPTWIATPHFFKSGNLIVLYLGQNKSILDFLQAVLDNQFAGGK